MATLTKQDQLLTLATVAFNKIEIATARASFTNVDYAQIEPRLKLLISEEPRALLRYLDPVHLVSVSQGWPDTQ